MIQRWTYNIDAQLLNLFTQKSGVSFYSSSSIAVYIFNRNYILNYE